jgi:hypothetical protein
MRIKWLFTYLYPWKLRQKPVYFCFLILLSPAIGDPICMPTHDMLIGLFVLETVEVFVQIDIIVAETLQIKK